MFHLIKGRGLQRAGIGIGAIVLGTSQTCDHSYTKVRHRVSMTGRPSSADPLREYMYGIRSTYRPICAYTASRVGTVIWSEIGVSESILKRCELDHTVDRYLFPESLVQVLFVQINHTLRVLKFIE